MCGDLNDTLNASGIPFRVTSGGDGNDTLIGGLACDLLAGGLGRDRFRSGGGNDVINADEVTGWNWSFVCGESTGDTDTVNADLSPADPVGASARTCEVVPML